MIARGCDGAGISRNFARNSAELKGAKTGIIEAGYNAALSRRFRVVATALRRRVAASDAPTERGGYGANIELNG
jgi:hypothetical protein